jgi:cytoskeleton protein RodZ
MPVLPNGEQQRLFTGPRSSSHGLTVGLLLRERRLEYRWHIDDVAAQLKIRPEYLLALENDQIEALPGAAYAVGFIRAYGDFLGFDGKEIAGLFKEEKSVVARTPELTFPIPLTERGIPGSSLIMVALIVCVLGYGAWAWFNSGPRTSLAAVQPVPARLLPPADLDPPAISPESAAAAELRQPALPPAGATAAVAPQQPYVASASLPPATPLSPSSVVIARGGTTTNQNVATTAAPGQQLASLPAGATPDPSHVFGGTAPGHVVVKATADSWVEVLDDGHQIWTGTLKPGDVYYPPKDGLVMRTGNAGGLEVSVDGHTLPPVGTAGEVKRIALDPTKLPGG